MFPQGDDRQSACNGRIDVQGSETQRMSAVGYLETNVLYCDNNLDRLSQFPDESVDLVYLDPPFFSNKTYEVIWGDEAEVRSFEDRWEGGINHYIEWMAHRVRELHRVLKPTGSLYLHCDWHASHHLRVMLDDIFGASQFRNEIIWHYRRWTGEARSFLKMHDTIFFYSKSNDYNFNRQFTEYTEASKERKKNHHTRIKGDDVYVTSVDERGVGENDVWQISLLNSQARERLGYPTQKPEALLERIVAASSNPGDVVLDPFAGCGTTQVVAERMKRQWIGMDISPTAVTLMRRRLIKATNGAVDMSVVGMPISAEDLRTLKPFEFQNWVIQRVNGTHSARKTNDMGIDGFWFLTHDPIQVKQSDRIGRNVIDNFETAIERAKHDTGYVVGFSFTRGAREEVARARREKELNITLIEVKDLITDAADLRAPDLLADLDPPERPDTFLDLPLPAARKKASRPSIEALLKSEREAARLTD